MQEEKESAQNVTGAATTLDAFLKSYSLFLNETETLNLDMDTLLNDLTTQINYLSPPTHASERINELWSQGRSLEKEQINKLANKFNKLNEEKLYNMIANVERLNYKLNMDYSAEINRGVAYGLYNPK